jgi:hypothetical protein
MMLKGRSATGQLTLILVGLVAVDKSQGASIRRAAGAWSGDVPKAAGCGVGLPAVSKRIAKKIFPICKPGPA